MRVEESRQLRVGVLEVPACHLTIITVRIHGRSASCLLRAAVNGGDVAPLTAS
jgi:hypothetical protein